jgi:alkylation response protein AidB-like acyl-CoA dehydrogenase
MADDLQSMTLNRADWRELIEAIGPELEAEGRACDRDNRFVARNLDRLEAAGLFALGVPSEFGGAGAGPAELGAMIRAVGRFDGSTALALAMHTHQVAIATWRRANTGAPTEGPLRAVGQDGKRLLSSGGSDWLPGSGEAVKVEGGFRVQAVKAFSSGSPDGDLLMTCAVYDDPVEGPTVLHFGVPMSAPEVSIRETWDTLGMRGTASQDVAITDVFVPEAAVGARRPPGHWHPVFHMISMVAFPLIYSVYAGVADGARAAALELARKRAADPAVQIAVGEMETAHTAMDIAFHAMVAAGEGTPSPETTGRIMTLRQLVGRGAIEVGSKALDCAGGAGFYRTAGLEQRFRDLQAARFHPLQEKPQQLYAARIALGLSVDG